ncbi:MAG: hypothetical protein KGZ83_03730 [Sulfuricella sp.]|nr:hypothetical protein [Sulfuricella sp.]
MAQKHIEKHSIGRASGGRMANTPYRSGFLAPSRLCGSEARPFEKKPEKN